MAIIGSDISEAARLLQKGELVAVPTETVYGLAGNAFDGEVVARIFATKGRPSFDPLIVHLPGPEVLEQVVSSVPDKARKLAEQLWPGPLTLVLPRKTMVPDLVTSGLETVAVRVPNHPLTLDLLARLEFPLACPSANPFGYISPTSASHVEQQLGSKIPYILDGGPCSIGIESTIVGFEQERPVIYRPGGIPVEQIEEIIGSVGFRTTTAKPITPGMMDSHYAPGKTLFLGNIRDLINSVGPEKAGILSFRDSFKDVPENRQIQLSKKGDLVEAAQNLFASLRKLDAMDINYIFTELVPNQGLGIAINDRLNRASTKPTT